MWAVLLQKAGLGSTSSTMESDMEAEVEKFEENAIKTIPLKDADDIGEKTKKTELLKGVEADKDKWILTRRKQIIRGEKFKHHKLKVLNIYREGSATADTRSRLRVHVHARADYRQTHGREQVSERERE